jgi:DNA polymerase
MTAWIAKEDDVLQGYWKGDDPYKVAASKMYHIPYEEITKRQRQVGKVFTLLAGFQGGAQAVIKGALVYGLVLGEQEAQEGINAFRAARQKLVRTWKAFGAAAIEAIQNPGSEIKVSTNRLFSFLFKEQHLFMKFPNGKVLCFPFARYEMWKMPWGKTQMSVTHMWVNIQNGNKWERRGISGASLMQSAVQGLSGQLLFEANLRLRKEGYDVRFRVHDELTALVPDDASSSLDHFTKVFTESPEWAEGLPIAADPWINRRYKK